jgi:hypothetical protein
MGGRTCQPPPPTQAPVASATTPADDAEEWSADHLVRWLRLRCAPVLKSSRMLRDAEEWSEDRSGAPANFANERA